MIHADLRSDDDARSAHRDQWHDVITPLRVSLVITIIIVALAIVLISSRAAAPDLINSAQAGDARDLPVLSSPTTPQSANSLQSSQGGNSLTGSTAAGLGPSSNTTPSTGFSDDSTQRTQPQTGLDQTQLNNTVLTKR